MKTKDIIKLIDSIIDNLEGEWLLVGGSLLNYLNINDRQTLDIDLVPLSEITNTKQLEIMKVAEENGFPPETINFSAEYFVKRQPGWDNELIILKKGKMGTLFRPSKKLFRDLKLQRGTETDLNDIEIYENNIRE